MRTPTPIAEAFAWHTAALAGEDPDITDDPRCGWFKRRLVKMGPWVPARIWLDQEIDVRTGELLDDERLVCDVNGRRCDPEDQWVWLSAEPISRAEFNYMEAMRRHAAAHEPDHPAANPRRAINHLSTPLHF